MWQGKPAILVRKRSLFVGFDAERVEPPRYDERGMHKFLTKEHLASPGAGVMRLTMITVAMPRGTPNAPAEIG